MLEFEVPGDTNHRRIGEFGALGFKSREGGFIVNSRNFRGRGIVGWTVPSESRSPSMSPKDFFNSSQYGNLSESRLFIIHWRDCQQVYSERANPD